MRNIQAILASLTLLIPAWVGSQSLPPLIDEALKNHPSVASQRAQVESAKSGVDSARWQYFPTPSISIENAQAGASDLSYQGDSTVKILRLQQPLWTGGRLTAGMQKAQAQVLISEAATEDARQQLALRVVQTYGDYLSGQLKVQAHEKGLLTHQRLQALVQRRIDLGAAAASDLTLTISRLQALNADLSLARAQRDIALSRLGQLLGRPVRSSELALADAPRTLSPDLQALTDKALAISPSVIKAQAQVQVQTATLSERQSDLKPELYLRAERQYGNYSLRDAPPEDRIFVGLTSRFGAGLSSLSGVQAAKAQVQAATLEIETQQRLVIEQVQSDHALALSTQMRLVVVQSSLKAAQDVADSYDRQFLAGRKTWIDVMNAARELGQTEAQLADIASALLVSTWRLAIYTESLNAVLQAHQGPL